MLVTQVLVVICAVSGTPCVNYVHYMFGTLSVDGCGTAIDKLAREHTIPGTVLRRELSSCERIIMNTQADGNA
jgi:hypothetical protein